MNNKSKYYEQEWLKARSDRKRLEQLVRKKISQDNAEEFEIGCARHKELTTYKEYHNKIQRKNHNLYLYITLLILSIEALEFYLEFTNGILHWVFKVSQ